jgi:hypothetical protein
MTAIEEIQWASSDESYGHCSHGGYILLRPAREKYELCQSERRASDATNDTVLTTFMLPQSQH